MDPIIDFLAVGPQKTATSWLYSTLRHASCLSFPTTVKETFYWDRNFPRGLPWYEQLFDARSAGRLRGEIGPTYFSSADALKRIQMHAPHCRIIITVRDPAARTYSHYLHERKKGRVRVGFAEALASVPDLCDGSRYAEWIPRWRDAFGPAQVHVVLLDDVMSRPQSVIADIWGFLGLPLDQQPEPLSERVNAASLPRFPRLAGAMTWLAAGLRKRGWYGVVEWGKRLGLKRVYEGAELPEDGEAEARAVLGDRFAADIAAVEQLLGRSLPHWTTGKRLP